jgi:hypothetical protein
MATSIMVSTLNGLTAARSVSGLSLSFERRGVWPFNFPPTRRPADFLVREFLAMKPVGKPDAPSCREWKTGRRASVSTRLHPRLYLYGPE